MEHLAIDLGGKESQVCIRQAVGDILLEQRLRTAALKKYLATRPPSRVVVETCTEAFAVADAALAAGHEVRVVPAQSDPMVRWAEEIEMRRGKRIAIVALARKMAGIMYAIWRDGATSPPTSDAVTTANVLAQAGRRRRPQMQHA